eukprot:comp22099_c0_seq3/m.32239 comp22099_c0_seq3/g.32239  ORF comp22099_c0_seq3/g.32239 comp22099_c0_seq3/m.32239 type:complete len:674 (-) comp22099_c0_seq3:74-2095(-)
MPIRSVTVGALAALAAVQVDAAVDCTGKNIEWDIQYQTDGYKYDEAAGTTTFCYTVGYKTAIDTADPLCSPAGGTPNPLTILGARFESCFTNENAGLRDEEGSWVPAPNDEGYVAETMGGDNEFNGDQWTTALPAVGSTGTYCATIRRKLNVSPTPNTAFLLGNNDRYSVVQVQGPECYLAPTSSTTEPPSTTTTPPPTTTTVPPPTTTTVPPPPTTTTPPPPTTTVPPPPTTTTIPPPTTTTTTTSKWKAPGTCNTTTYYSGMSTYYTCGGNNTCGCLKNITSWSNKCGLGLMPVDGITQVCTGVADTAEPDLTTLNSQMQALGSKCTAQEYLWRLQYVFSSCGSTYTNQSVCDCQAAVSSAQECLTPSEWTLATPNYTVIAPNNVCDLPSWASKNCTKDIYLALATDVFHKCSAYWLTAPNATASAPADSECCASRTLVKTKCGITWDQYTMKPKCATTGKKSSSKKTPTNYPPIPVATPTYHQCSSISSGGGSGMGYSVYCVGLDGSKRYVWEGGMGSGGGFSAFDTSSGIYQGSFNGGGGGGASVYTDVCTQDQYNADLCVENGYMGMGMGGGSASPKPPQSGADINTDSNFKQFNRAFHDALQIINNRRTCPIILISGGGGGGGGYSAASVAEQDAFNWNTGYGFEFEIVLCPGCRPKNTACPTALPY